MAPTVLKEYSNLHGLVCGTCSHNCMRIEATDNPRVVRLICKCGASIASASDDPVVREALDSQRDDDHASTMPRISETHQSLMIYACIIRAGGAVNVRQIMNATDLADGTVYPILQKRVAAGLMKVDDGSTSANYDFTAVGYERAKDHLLDLEVNLAFWLHTDQRFR